MMNVLDLATSYGLIIKKAAGTNGGEFSSNCPFCGGDDRFRIWPEQNTGSGSYWCRQCSAHGDRIQFVMDTQKIGFKAACQVTGDMAIAEMYKSDAESPYVSRVPDAPRVPADPDLAPHHPKAAYPATLAESQSLWEEKAFKLVCWAAERLPGSEGERLLEEKGVSAGTAANLGLGWITEDVYRPRESWGLPTVIKEDTGKPKKLWIPKGLVIPHFTIKTPTDYIPTIIANEMDPQRTQVLTSISAVSRLRIRRPEGEPRYYVVPGSDAAQMILGKPGRSVVVVESELDAILIDQVAGDITGIIAMGTSHAKPDPAANAMLSAALCILVAMDFDAAGKSSFAWWEKAYPRARRWPVPAGKDPSDAANAGVDLRSWVIAGWPAGWRVQSAAAIMETKPDPLRQSLRPAENAISLATEPTSAETPAVSQHPENNPGDCASMTELHGLLKKNPRIRIIINDSRLSIDAPSEWQRRNEGLFSRISRLVYFDPDVFSYLHAHGAKEISSGNFLDGKRSFENGQSE